MSLLALATNGVLNDFTGSGSGGEGGAVEVIIMSDIEVIIESELNVELEDNQVTAEIAKDFEVEICK